ncbi:hypothetical protein GFM07_32285 [Rhizobium leguminosarum bv. viciae]|nr:hypothetical protein [Rhizobium leguminosarum bv. viciae]
MHPHFISELVRAANEADKLTSVEVTGLLDRAITTVRELREQAGIVPLVGRDALIYVQTVSAGSDRVSREQWHHGLLHAAEMIRDLHIVLVSGTKIGIAVRQP